MQETYLNGGNPSLEELHAEDVAHDDVKDGAVDDNMEDAKKVADFSWQNLLRPSYPVHVSVLTAVLTTIQSTCKLRLKGITCMAATLTCHMPLHRRPALLKQCSQLQESCFTLFL